jgi:pimeloyl-ACP methyl ester carboxylesterase
MIISVNNVHINYEVYGKGKPIILLHGNSENHKIFDKLIEKLKKDYKVYAIDSRCQGDSEKTKEISYELMAQDTIEFIKKLEIKKPILYGFSDGGIIGLLIAIKEPYLLLKLIVSGANLNPNAMSKAMLNISKLVYFVTRNKLFKMMINEPNIQPEELMKIKIPTYVLAGEKDIIKQDHTELIANNIPNSVLKIVKNENHSSYIIHNDKIYEIIKDFI